MKEERFRSLSRKAVVCAVLCTAIAVRSFSQGLEAEQRFNYVLHDTLEHADVVHLVRALEASYERIQNDLRVSSLPVISVQIWSEEEGYQAAMEETLGMRFPGSRGYVTGDRELRLLYHRLLSAQREAVHEFAHVVSLNLNPEFGNNPRWLWEAVAMYEAEEFRDPREVPYMREGSYPSLQELNTDFNSGRSIYDVGYLLVDYIINTWDRDHLIALIHSSGSIEKALGISETDFEAGWHQYIEDKYLIPSH